MGAFWHAVAVFFEHLADVKWQALGLALACQVIKLLFRARAWQNIIRASYPDNRLRFRSAFGAYAFSISARSAMVVQVLRTSGPFHYRPGSDLGRTAMEAAFGARHRLIGGRILEWAIIENLDRYQNTPDIGVFLGLTLREAGGKGGSRPWPRADNPLQRHRLPGGLE